MHLALFVSSCIRGRVVIWSACFTISLLFFPTPSRTPRPSIPPSFFDFFFFLQLFSYVGWRCRVRTSFYIIFTVNIEIVTPDALRYHQTGNLKKKKEKKNNKNEEITEVHVSYQIGARRLAVWRIPTSGILSSMTYYVTTLVRSCQRNVRR